LKALPAILLFFLSIAAAQLLAQDAHPILRGFTGQVAGNSIRLSWVIKGGNTCEGTKVQRSADGLFFETIGEIGGVCGSPDFDVPYLFVDSLPIASQTNYYRLELGTQGFSTPISFQFVPLNNKGYTLIYDPLLKAASIYFDNSRNETAEYVLIRMNGSVDSRGVTRDDNLNFNFEGQSAGIYLIRISMPNRVINAQIPAF